MKKLHFRYGDIVRYEEEHYTVLGCDDFFILLQPMRVAGSIAINYRTEGTPLFYLVRSAPLRYA